MKYDPYDKDRQRIAELEAEIAELHATIGKLHDEYRPDVKAALNLKGWQQENAELQERIQAMYEALVASGSINRIPEAHEWVVK